MGLSTVLVLALAAEPALEQLAAEAFARGEASFRDDDYPAALESFRRAMSLAPRDAVRFNLGVCLERLGRFYEAFEQYQLAAASSDLDEAARRRAKEQAARVQPRLGVLAIDARPGAKVRIDGSRECAAPCELQLDPGDHAVESLTDPGAPIARVSVGRGERRVVTLASAEVAAPAPAPRSRAGPLTWVGAATGAVGLGVFAGFGLRTLQLHSAYLAGPTEALRNEGLISRGVANGALVVAAIAVVAIVIDLFIIR